MMASHRSGPGFCIRRTHVKLLNIISYCTPHKKASGKSPDPEAVGYRTAEKGVSLKDFQVIVIGSGPGGYVAAIRAASNGLKTAIVEKDPFLGGTCLHRGCIPTKALLHSAEVYDECKHADELGISIENLKIDVATVYKRKNRIVGKLSKGIAFLMKKRKVEVFTGLGSFVDAGTIRVAGPDGEETIKGDHIVIATGSVPMSLPHMEPDGKSIINSDHILQMEEIPGRLAVVGSGAVGVEFASIFRSFGSEVALIELLPHLLPLEDEECAAELDRSFKARGIKNYIGTEVTAIAPAAGKKGAVLSLSKDAQASSLEVDKVLVAIGRRPVTDGLGHEAIGVEMDGRFIRVDEYMRTSVPNVYAIGDVVKTPQLAHVASAEGILAMDHIAGRHVDPIDYEKIPSCTYSQPEVASVGLTEKTARERGYDVRVGKFPFSAIGKAMIVGKTGGFVKIVSEARYDEVLGVHIIGPKATELIAEACLGMKLETTVEEIAHTVHAHPTLSEAMLEAAHGVYGEAIHI
jgi:dihydrolipoamide dehydrogenase